MNETQVIIDLTGPAMILVTLAGPVVAVWASEWRYTRRQAQEKREQIFQTLISTRATRLNIVHVESLNQIDFVFQGNRYSQIRESWALYRKHLQLPESASAGDALVVWQSKSADLFADLLHEIGKGLKFSFSKSYIIENSYRPNAHLYAELDSARIRKLLLEVLEDGRPLNIREIGQFEEQNNATQGGTQVGGRKRST